MSNAWLANKKVLVIGLGMTGQSCLRFLLPLAAKVEAADTRTALKHETSVPVHLGPIKEALLLAFDLIIVSPGVDIRGQAFAKAQENGIEVIGDVELFARFNSTPVIAVTGSNGKSTVTSLVHHTLSCAGKQVEMAGNIGKPVLDLLNKELDFIVLELSSFQLETLTSLRPLAATVLNVSPDHLDRYDSYGDYHQAKLKIYHQAQNIVVNRDDEKTQGAEPYHMSFGLGQSNTGYGWNGGALTFASKPWFSIDACHLQGLHNVLNIQAAAALLSFASVEDDVMKKAFCSFTGLPHRCELVAKVNGIEWINDSKATNVGATIAAIDGIKSQIKGHIHLIAGGDAKGADLSSMKSMLQQDVATTITLGQDGDKIANLARQACSVSSLIEAVKYAHTQASQGDVVILSPACASLDMFENYQARGLAFKAAVEEVVMS